MFSNVTYNNLQEDFEQDRQWLAKEWERRQLKESVDANDSDTMTCSDFDSIDDLREVTIQTKIYYKLHHT